MKGTSLLWLCKLAIDCSARAHWKQQPSKQHLLKERKGTEKWCIEQDNEEFTSNFASFIITHDLLIQCYQIFFRIICWAFLCF